MPGQMRPEPRAQLPRAPDTPGWRAQHQVLCIAGRGPLDELAAAILAQLLDKHGLSCRIVPHEAASRTKIGELDVGDATIVCIVYLDIVSIPSNPRYLLRRVRQRLPGAMIIVGLWPTGVAEQWSDDLQSTIGADHYAYCARDMVSACLNPPQPPSANSPTSSSTSASELTARPAELQEQASKNANAQSAIGVPT
jgi:hypothetical protein